MPQACTWFCFKLSININYFSTFRSKPFKKSFHRNDPGELLFVRQMYKIPQHGATEISNISKKKYKHEKEIEIHSLYSTSGSI